MYVIEVAIKAASVHPDRCFWGSRLWELGQSREEYEVDRTIGNMAAQDFQVIAVIEHVCVHVIAPI